VHGCRDIPQLQSDVSVSREQPIQIDHPKTKFRVSKPNLVNAVKYWVPGTQVNCLGQ
jgi:hypothetical protein